MEVKSRFNILLVPLVLGLVVMVLFVISLGTLGSKNVKVDGVVVGLQRVSVKADKTGGLQATTVSNYNFLVNHYGGYTYASALQHYLGSYLRIAHTPAYGTLSIDESSFKQVDDQVSTFTAHYGNNIPLQVKVTNVDGNVLTIEITSDAGNSVTYSTGPLDITAVN